MNILLTGASGFLGRQIYRILAQQHTITTVGRTACSPRHIHCDLAEQVPALPAEPFDLVINAAGKANSVPRSAIERAEYQRVNVVGTAHLLTALEKQPVLPKSIVHISTVLVYGRSVGELLPETTPLEATDPYGLSKIEAEKLLHAWTARMGVRLAILRLPLVVAEPLSGNLASMQKAIRQGYYVRIGDGLIYRSMVRADDVADVVLRAAAVGGTFNLTDGYHPTVRELEETLAKRLGRVIPVPVIPVAFARVIASLGDRINNGGVRRFPLDAIALQKLTSSLTFSDELAREQLDWNPRSALDLIR